MTIDEIRRDRDWGHDRTYCIADEPAQIAARLIGCIPEHRDTRHLEYAEILWLYTSKTLRDKGRIVIAKVSKVHELAQAMLLGDSDEGDVPDFVVVVGADEWEKLTTEQQEAAVDHELCHMWMADCAIPTLLPHDLQEFRGVVERHGLYLEDLRLMARTIQPHLPGLSAAQNACGALNNLARQSNATVTLSSGDRQVTFGDPATHLEIPERELVKADPDDRNSLDCTIIKHELTPEQQGQMDTILQGAAASASQ
jgi:hypothetical protein